MSTYKKPKTWATVIKVLFALTFLDVGIAPDPEFEAGARGLSIIIGIGLFLWAYLPYRNYKRSRQEVLKEMERQEQEIDSMKAAINNRPWKCSHCGAVTRGEVCEYCDSPREG